MHQAAKEIELWLASDRPTERIAGIDWTVDAPAPPPVVDTIRRRAGEALMEAGRRVMPPAEPRRSRAF